MSRKEIILLILISLVYMGGLFFMFSQVPISSSTPIITFNNKTVKVVTVYNPTNIHIVDNKTLSKYINTTNNVVIINDYKTKVSLITVTINGTKYSLYPYKTYIKNSYVSLKLIGNSSGVFYKVYDVDFEKLYFVIVMISVLIISTLLYFMKIFKYEKIINSTITTILLSFLYTIFIPPLEETIIKMGVNDPIQAGMESVTQMFILSLVTYFVKISLPEKEKKKDELEDFENI